MATYSLAEIASHIGGTLHGNSQAPISGAAEINKAGPGQITFLANPKYKEFLQNSRASAVILDAKAGVTPKQDYILVKDAYFGFLQAFLLLNPQMPLLNPGIHPTAVIEDGLPWVTILPSVPTPTSAKTSPSAPTARSYPILLY